MAKINSKRIIQAVCVMLQFHAATTLFFAGPAFILFLMFCTTYWYFAFTYLIWIWIIDRHTPEKGGRTISFFRRSKFSTYGRNYFPVTVNAVPDFQLDSTKNYIFCGFPHGVMATGFVSAFSNCVCGADTLFPNHTVHFLSLQVNFMVPLYRDYLLSFGLCSVSANSITHLLNYSKGGQVIALLPGGAAESFYSSPGVYKILLRKRKGFIKLAIQNGSAIVPMFSFGEVDIFKPMCYPEDSIVRRIQNWIKSKTGIAPILYMGDGLLPKSTPINVVVGKPIEVEKNINPSQHEIDTLHELFTKRITELFEEYKHKYIENADETQLIIL